MDAHHVRHWAEGGATELDNLILLCTHHHRLVHEDGYEVHKDGRGQWYFQRGDGRAVPSCGYLPQDTIDEDIGEDSNAWRYPSAEALADGCAESTVRYRPGEHDFDIRGAGVRFIAGTQGPVWRTSAYDPFETVGLGASTLGKIQLADAHLRPAR